MTSYKDRKAVAHLAKQYGMPESDIRQMLAIEAGKSIGDVIVVSPKTPLFKKLGQFVRSVRKPSRLVRSDGVSFPRKKS